jgi:Flp pilus assembly protein TadD
MRLRPSLSGPSPARRAGVAALALALALAGCQSTSRMTTGSIGRAAEPAASFDRMTDGELRRATDTYGAAYAKAPKDKATGLGYASLLQMTGRNDQSLAVMRQMAIVHSRDRDVLAAYGKALAASGDLEKALETVRRAQTPDRPDWRLLSAEGAILDQLGQSAEARVLYRKALDIRPDEPTVLSNLGMSYVLANDLKTAETYLRQAAERPGAESRVRQNLALVVGLQGRFEEAERIAGAELSPEDATANVAYLKRMLAQQNTWSMLKDKDSAKGDAAKGGAADAAGRS